MIASLSLLVVVIKYVDIQRRGDMTQGSPLAAFQHQLTTVIFKMIEL
jgi:hypothetical protein